MSIKKGKSGGLEKADRNLPKEKKPYKGTDKNSLKSLTQFLDVPFQKQLKVIKFQFKTHFSSVFTKQLKIFEKKQKSSAVVYHTKDTIQI